MASQTPPEVLFVAPLREPASPADLQRLAEGVAGQVGVRAQLMVIDLTREGQGNLLDGTEVVRPASPALKAGLELALDRALAAFGRAAEFVAWCDPRVLLDPQRASLQVAGLSHSQQFVAVTSVVATNDEAEQPRVFDGSRAGDEVVPFWQASLMARTAALGDLEPQAFAPVELRWIKRLAAAESLTSCAESLGYICESAIEAEARQRADDWVLDEVRSKPLEHERPLVSVLLATHQRRDVLLECLEGFARQLVPPGWHEIVVVDDGSRDGTFELLEALRLDVPLRVLQQPNSGPATARNRGLEVATGELVLFVNDDTIPAPDLIEQHLRAHWAHREPVSILGTFEQPPHQLRTLGMQLLERVPLVFQHMQFEDGQELEPERYYTCNVSTPLNAVRMVGGFDEAFRRPAAEDTELGLRLSLAGLPLYYCAAARSEHRHVLEFADLQRRQPMVGREHVRMWARHPEVLRKHDQAIRATRERLEIAQRLGLGLLGDSAEAAKALFELDVSGLEGEGGLASDLICAAEGLLEELLTRLCGVWFNAGLLEGLFEHGVDSFAELAEAASDGECAMPGPFGLADLAAEQPEVSLIALLDQDDRPAFEAWVANLRRGLAGGPAVELLVCDGRHAPTFDLDRVRTLRPESLSRGARLRQACSEARSEVLVLLPPGLSFEAGALAAHLVALETEPNTDLVTAPIRASAYQQATDSSAVERGWWGAALRASAALNWERRTFAPAEAHLLEAIERTGRCTHREGPGVIGSEQHLLELARQHGSDRQLLGFCDESCATAPLELTVLMVLGADLRPEEWMACLEAFARQIIPAGSFELVAIDASGTADLTDPSDLDLPFGSSLFLAANCAEPWAAMINRGLEQVRGRLVLFGDPRVLPGPDCLSHHLAAHRAWSDQKPVAIRGPVQQPEDGLGRATSRYYDSTLQDSPSLATLTPGATYGAKRFEVGNLSLDRQWVAKVGGLNEAFGTPGLAGRELGARLCARGMVVQVVPEASSRAALPMGWVELQDQQVAAATGEVAFFLKHPAALDGDLDLEATTEGMEARLAQVEADLSSRGRVLSAFGDLPLAPFERFGGFYAEFADCIADSLRHWMPGLLEARRLRGRLNGLRKHRLASLAPVWKHRDRLLLVSNLSRHLFAWPRWGDRDSLDDLVQAIEPLLDSGTATLVLRHDPAIDPDKATAFAAFEQAFSRCYPAAPRLDVLIEDRELEPWRFVALGRACTAWLRLGGEPEDRFTVFPAEPLDGREALEAWLRRFQIDEARDAA